MLVANVFALFDHGLRFRAIGDVPDEIVSIAPDRWDVDGEVGVATTSRSLAEAADDVDQLLLLLADVSEVVDTGRLQVVAALPVEDSAISLAIIAIAIDRPVTRGWLGAGGRSLELQRAALEGIARRDLAELREQLGDEIESLRAQLAQAHRAKRAAEELYRTARTSSAYRLGSLLGESARHPMRAVTGLPKGLSEIVRDRPEAAAQADRSAELVAAVDAATATTPVVRPRNDLVHRAWTAPAIPPVSEPGVQVAHLAHPFHGGTRRSAWQFDLFPGDHIRNLEWRIPDAVVIDASATLPGSPWAGSGSGIGQGMAAMVADVVRWSNRAGIPTVFRWDLPPHQAPVFSRIASSCDLVVTTERGGLASAPLLRHGVVAGRATDRKSMRTLTVFPSLELGSDEGPPGESPEVTAPEGWESQVTDMVIIHSPEDMRHVLSGTGVAVVPATTGVPLVLLESVASGAVTVASVRSELRFVVDPADVGWEDTELISLQDHAREQVLTTAWAIRHEFSTLAETRTMGRLLRVDALSDLEGVTAILVAEDGSESAAFSFVDDVAGLIDVLILTGEDVLVRGIAARASEHGIRVRIAAGAGDLAEQIRATTRQSWWVWPVDPVQLQGSGADVLRSLLTGLGSDAQPLLAARSLLALSDRYLSEAARPRR